MNKFISSIDGLPKIAKIILAIPILDIIWVIYRIFKSAVKKNTVGVILGILLLIIGIPFLWIIDMISLFSQNKVVWID